MDQVEEVKAKTDIVSLIAEFIELKKAGRNFKALCPFHSEKTPSFMVSPELQIYKCFGCQKSGDIFTFLQEYEGMDFYEALKQLAQRAGVKLKPLKSRGEKEGLYEINAHASKFYHYILLNHKAGEAALSYLAKQRGLKMSTIKAFQLGFSPNVPFAAKKYLMDKKGFRLQDLEKAGLVFSKSGRLFDRFRGRIIFPLFDHRGNAIGLAGRLLPSENLKNRQLAKYINSPETPVYSKSKVLYGLNLVRSEIKKKGEAVIVEGELDMISSWQAGIKNTVAIKGTALTEDQLRLLARFAKKLTLALDADMAGNEAARRGINLAQEIGLEVKVAVLKNFKDPDEMARRAPDEYKKLLRSAIGVWDFIVSQVFSRYDQSTAEGKSKIGRELVPVLSSIEDKIIQAHYVQLVANKLSIPAEAVVEQISRTKKAQIKAKRVRMVAIPKPKTKSRRQLLEERLLTLAFQSKPEILTKKEIISLVKMPLTSRILEEYELFNQKKLKFDPSVFANNLPKELVRGFTDLVLKDVGDLVDKPDALNKELDLVVKELKIMLLKERLSLLGKKIKNYEEKDKKVELKKAEEKFQKLSLKLSELKKDETSSIML